VSGFNGFIRQLTAAEIVGQIMKVRRTAGVKATNIVMMGIGEPLDNHKNLAEAIHVINHPDGLRIGARKITISTCGLVPAILKLEEIRF